MVVIGGNVEVEMVCGEENRRGWNKEVIEVVKWIYQVKLVQGGQDRNGRNKRRKI